MLYCFQEKKSGAPSCLQEKGTGALLISGERNWCSTVIKEKETGAILLMFQEKGTGALLFSGEGRLGCTFKNGSGAGCCTKFTG